MITQERLKEILSYDPVTGIFKRIKADNNYVKVGDVVGWKDKKGYINTKIDNKTHKMHRLVWLYVYGYLPENQIDHINRVKKDNRILNLREASGQCNARNTGNLSTNTSGVKGVYYDKAAEKWAVYINTKEKRFFMGRYEDFDEAVCARLAGEQSLDWSRCDSSSTACQYVKKHIANKEVAP